MRVCVESLPNPRVTEQQRLDEWTRTRVQGSGERTTAVASCRPSANYCHVDGVEKSNVRVR